MGRNRVLGSPYEQVGVTASFTTEPHVDRYLVSTPGGGPSVVVTLDPNAFDGDQVVILDAAGNAEAHPITVVGTLVNGESTINNNGGSVQYTFSIGLGGWTTQASEGSDALVALGNFATIMNLSLGATSAGVTNYIPAAIVLTPKVSGIFRVDLSLGYFDTTAAEAVTFQIIATEATVPSSPITITNGTSVGLIGADASASSLAEVTAVAGTSLVLGNAAGTTSTLDSKAILSAAVLDTAQSQLYQASGIFGHNQVGPPPIVPFTLNVPLIFFLTITVPAGAVSAMKIQFSVQEQPFA